MKIYASILLLLSFTQYTFAETLCNIKPKQHGLVIGEDQYSFENAFSSINYLQNEIPKMIEKNHDSLKEKLKKSQKVDNLELLQSDAVLEQAFYIDYPNNFSIIRGALLKQNALALKYKYQVTKYRNDKILFEKALKTFCDWGTDASYVD